MGLFRTNVRHLKDLRAIEMSSRSTTQQTITEVSQYVQRDHSSLSRQRIALETQTRVDPRLAEELLHSRQFLNTNMQACPISEKKLTLPSVLFNQTGFDRSGYIFGIFKLPQIRVSSNGKIRCSFSKG